MKKWMGLIIMAVVAAFTFTSQAAIVDEWDMNGNGQWQNSNNGLNLGSQYNTNNQQFAQTADDGLFLFSPLSLGDNYGGKVGLTSTVDVTQASSEIVRVQFDMQEINWTNTPTVNSKMGYRVWSGDGSTGTEWISLEIADNAGTDKVFAYLKTGADLGGVNQKLGRVVNSLQGVASGNIIIDIDFGANEIRCYSSSWDYFDNMDPNVNPDTGVYTVSVPSLATVSEIGTVQPFYVGWGTGDTVEADTLRISALAARSSLTDVTIYEQQTLDLPNTPSSNNFTYIVEEGDMVVVMAASNKGADPAEGSVTFSGSAVLGETVYSRRNNGPVPQYWYVPVLAGGVVNAELITVDSFNAVAAYHLRGITDEGVVVLATSKDGVGDAGSTSVTTSYSWDKSDSGIYLEAISTYGGGNTPLDPGAVIDVDQATKRSIAHGSFASTNELVNIWTNVLDKVAIVGLAVQSDRIPETDDLITYKLDDPAGTDIKDLEQVGIDDNSFSGLGDGILTDGAGNLVYSNCVASTYRTHDFEKAVTNGVIVLEFKVSDWDYTGMPDGTGVGFSLINTNNGDTAKISFDFKPTASPAGTRIAFVGEGDADYNAKLGITNGTDVAMRLRIDLDNDQFDTQYNVGNGWITQSVTNDLGFAEGVINRLQLVQNTAAWVAGAYVKVDYVTVAQVNARLVDFQLDDEAGTLFGLAYNPGTWDGAAWNFNGPFATDGAGSLRFDLNAADGGATRKFQNGTTLSNGVVNARWSVPAWDFLDGDGAMGVQWQLRDTNSAVGVKIQFDQNGTTDKTRVRAIDPLGTGKQQTFADGTLTNSTDGVDFRVRLDLDEGTMDAYWKYSADASWTLIDATLTNGITQLDEIWLVSTAPTGLGDAGYCDYDYFIVDYTPGGATGVTVIPNITDISVSGATVSLTWDSESGISYNVLSKAALTDLTWATNVADVAGTGTSTSADATGSGTEEFYTIEANTP